MSFIKPAKSTRRFALVDCNNFYVSCERLFRPKLWKRPVVVLSNNDGCVIARSQEVKDLGVPMGAPSFEYADLFKNHGVAVCSSNFALYGDLSHRVMEILRQFSPEMEVYSIDEAFLDLEVKDVDKITKEIKACVYKWVGIPVSIGVACTKTLAKVANHCAKKEPGYEGICHLVDKNEIEKVLRKLPLKEVWGIGSRKNELLGRYRMTTAWDFASADDDWIRKKLTVFGLRTAWELRGISCLPLEEAPSAKQTIMCSRSFRRGLNRLEDLAESVAGYTARAAEKLRKQKSLASFITVFIRTNPHSAHDPYYSNQAQFVLPQPTDFTPELIRCAKETLQKIYVSDLTYKKAGVMLGGLVSNGSYQRDLFVKEGPEQDKRVKVMRLMDRMNKKNGRKTVWLAAEGIDQPWKTERKNVSQKYTTSWDDLLKIF